MKILFTGGGTQGHVAPCIAVAEQLQKRKGAEALFAARRGGRENQSILDRGFSFKTIDIKSISACTLYEKLKYPLLLKKARVQAKSILEDFKPDAVFSSGGYVSYPIVAEAAALGIPIYMHESNAIAGRVTRMLAKHAKCLFLGMQGSEESFSFAKATRFTATPVKDEFFRWSREGARRALGIGNEFMILSLGGSLGAQKLNDEIFQFMYEYASKKGIYHVHSTGERYYKNIAQKYSIFLNNEGKCRAVSYINNMATYMKAADIVISRAGASTISEIRASGACSILIPSPNVKNNHQYHNAHTLVEIGGAVMLEEKQLSVQTLIEHVERLEKDSVLRMDLAKKAFLPTIRTSAKRILDTIEADLTTCSPCF